MNTQPVVSRADHRGKVRDVGYSIETEVKTFSYLEHRGTFCSEYKILTEEMLW